MHSILGTQRVAELSSWGKEMEEGLELQMGCRLQSIQSRGTGKGIIIILYNFHITSPGSLSGVHPSHQK